MNTMEYLTEEQMKYEKPIKNAYTKKNNALEKYLHQSGQNNSGVKIIPGNRINVYYSHRTNKVIVSN